MEFLELVRHRRSTRAFIRRPVEPEKLRAILEAANRAPSAGNLQGYAIYAVTQRGCLAALSHAANEQSFVQEAALALVFCANPAHYEKKYGGRGVCLYAIQDATIACAYAQLAAAALGLASTWVGAFDDNLVRAAIGAGKELLPIAILPIGYAGEKPDATTRRSLDSLVRYIA